MIRTCTPRQLISKIRLTLALEQDHRQQWLLMPQQLQWDSQMDRPSLGPRSQTPHHWRT